MTTEQTTPRHDDHDHEIWIRFYITILSSATAVPVQGGPTEIADVCADIADAALEQERRRRPDQESAYEKRGLTTVG